MREFLFFGRTNVLKKSLANLK